MTNLLDVSRYPQPKTFAGYLLLAFAWFAAQVVVAFPMLARVLSAAVQTYAKWWESADAVAIVTSLLLQSLFGAFFLWRLRRSTTFGWHVFKGIACGILSFLVAVPLAFFVMKFFYKPIITEPPVFFFEVIFYLGHRVPLLGVVFGGFLSASVHWVLVKPEPEAERVE